jgi:hypothetical protein
MIYREIILAVFHGKIMPDVDTNNLSWEITNLILIEKKDFDSTKKVFPMSFKYSMQYIQPEHLYRGLLIVVKGQRRSMNSSQ